MIRGIAGKAPEDENGPVRTQIRFMAALIVGLSFGPAWQNCSARPAQQPGSARTADGKTIPPPESRTDINHASVVELLKVPGMTPSWANRIVRFRPYRTKQDLLERGVLPSDVYDRIKNYVIAHREKQ
jgi:DNA uptake protein ComE-like DNA-binding protein